MQLIVKKTKNRIKITSEDPGLLNFIRRRMTVKNPNYRFTPFGQEEMSCISPTFTFMNGLLFDVLKEARLYDPTVEINLGDVKSIAVPFSIDIDELVPPENSEFIYRDYQEDSIRRGLKFGRGIFELATSAGKSLIIYGLIKNIWKYTDKKTVLVLVPNVQLVTQMAKDFINYGCDPSIICKFTATIERKVSPIAEIIVSNRSWLTKHDKELPDIDILIIDEAHMMSDTGSQTFKMASKLKTEVRYGFTGTMPEWAIAKWNVIGVTGQILKIKRARELQDLGHVAQTKIVAVRFNHHEKKPQTDPELLQLLAMARAEKNDDAVGVIKLEIAKARFPTEWRFIEDCDFTNQFMLKMMAQFDGNTIMLYDHIEHGNGMKEYLESIAPDRQVFLIDGSTSIAYREMVRETMEKDNNCFLLGNSKCIAVGINIKNINNVAFGFSSGMAASKVIQSIGRGLRLKEGKTYVRIIDFYHELRYSQAHFTERLKLYAKHYGINLSNIVHKAIDVHYGNELSNL